MEPQEKYIGVLGLAYVSPRLGFRNLESFNKALLANQFWRILHNIKSLAARVLNACYYLDVDFINAELKPTASFLWKSLIWGKEIVAARSRWRVGDELVRNVFCKDDSISILSIPISRSRAHDSILWHYDQKRTYSAKSGYWADRSLLSEPGSSHSGKSLFFDFILDCFSLLKMEDLSLFCVCLWKIWAIRNAAVHGSPPDKAVDVVDWAHFFIDEFHNASPAKNRDPKCPTNDVKFCNQFVSALRLYCLQRQG
ncbi:hypothetical protein Dsin_018491 [Dipteronia sinensis]|uniref:Uncharacterized protein n=1 Tax=Dipteronia sinensis TaxID=43782 RepID=A0AAE0E1U5_9ROSI|nr:hypothetical protein Dsin_018491 [Dipteronia sinensis]